MSREDPNVVPRPPRDEDHVAGSTGTSTLEAPERYRSLGESLTMID